MRRRVLLPRQVEPRLRAHHDERDLAGHHHRDRPEAHGHLLARDPRGRLHDRHDARLEEPDLLRHQGRPDRHRRRLDRGLQDPVLPRRGDLQLDGGRRDRRRLRGHRPSPAHPRGRQGGLPAGAVVGGVRPRHPDQARPALAGVGYDANAAGQGRRRDHRQRRAEDERAVLQAQRQRQEPADLQGAGVRERHVRDREQPRHGGEDLGHRGEQLRLRRSAVDHRREDHVSRGGSRRPRRRQVQGRVDQQRLRAHVGAEGARSATACSTPTPRRPRPRSTTAGTSPPSTSAPAARSGTSAPATASSGTTTTRRSTSARTARRTCPRWPAWSGSRTAERLRSGVRRSSRPRRAAPGTGCSDRPGRC